MEYAYTNIDFGQGPGGVSVPVARKRRVAPEPGKAYSALEVLTTFYGEDFNRVLGHFVEVDQDKIQKAGILKDAQTLRFLAYYNKITQSKLHQPTESTVVDFIVGTTVEDERKRTACFDVRVRYILDMRICEQAVVGPLIFVDKTFKDPILPNYTICTNEYLLPIMYARDYERVAHQMLERYFPEYMGTLAPKGFVLDAEELARRMGLTIRDVHFADPSVMGQVYIDFGEVELIDENGKIYKEKIKPGTILISIDNCWNPAIRNSTIVHECCHMYLDRTFFLLQMMTGRPLSAYTSRRKEKKQKHYNSPIDWMELQCEKLPAYLMLESASTGAFVESQVKEGRSIDRLKRTISAIADHFHVSKSMAKYRMIELGYGEAGGIDCFVDGRSVPDHGCGGKWPEGVTYTVSSYDAAVICAESSVISRKISSGRYIYVEGHFCLNDRRFIAHDWRGQLYLTPWARAHIDECCLAFRPRGRYTKAGYWGNKASRNKTEPVTDKYLPNYELAAEPDTDQYNVENSIFADDSYLWGTLYAQLPQDFQEATKMIMKAKGITQEALALEFGVERKVVYNILNEMRPSIEHVIALCVALKTPYYISDKLIYLSRNVLMNTERESLYRQFLLEPGKLTIERCNDILKLRKFSPLFQYERKVG